MSDKQNIKVDIKKLEDSRVEISGEIPAEKFQSYRDGVVQEFSKKVDVKGFRKGHVPEKMVIEKVGEGAILEQMAENALKDAYPSIILDNKIDAIDRPEITITKLAQDNPLGFKITQSVMPEVNLPDFRKIADEQKKKNENDLKGVVVTDDEVEKVITEIRNSRKKDKNDASEVAPALTDEFIKTLGDFKSVEDFKEKIKQNIKLEKEHKEKDKNRVAFLEAVREKTKMDLPKPMVERQIDQYISELKSYLAPAGLKWEDYLEKNKKTEEEIRADFREEARKKVALNLIMGAIGKEIKVEPKEEDIKRESDKLLQMYHGADPDSIRNYVTSILKSEAVFKELLG